MRNLKTFEAFNPVKPNWQDFYEKAKKSEDGFHQEIINYVHDTAKETKNHEEMTEWAMHSMGPEFGLLFHLGKYNYQVGNGGHQQYNGNGYDGTATETDDEPILHMNMIDAFQRENFDKLKHGPEVLKIMKDYSIVPMAEDCEECGGSGHIEDDGMSFGCGECGGSGESRYNYEINIEPDNLDDRYYAIMDSWMHQLEEKARSLVIGKILKEQGIEEEGADIEEFKDLF